MSLLFMISTFHYGCMCRRTRGIALRSPELVTNKKPASSTMLGAGNLFLARGTTQVGSRHGLPTLSGTERDYNCSMPCPMVTEDLRQGLLATPWGVFFPRRDPGELFSPGSEGGILRGSKCRTRTSSGSLRFAPAYLRPSRRLSYAICQVCSASKDL